MNNHVHLMATPSDHEQLAAFMSGYLQPYAQFRNRRRGASGKLFEQRFKSIPIRTETQLAATMAYIELNPVRAGLCVHPEDYRWSTYRVHAAHSGVEAVIEELWSPSGWYLALGFTMFERACFYREWVSECHRRDEWDGVVAEPRLPGDRKRFERPDRSQAI